MSDDNLAHVMNQRDEAITAYDQSLDGNRPLAFDRETLGKMVRGVWIRWAAQQPNPKPSWLVPWDHLNEPDKEVDRMIGEEIARWAIAGDAAMRCRELDHWPRQPTPPHSWAALKAHRL